VVTFKTPVFDFFCSHSSVFQVTSSIISSLNATQVVCYRYQFVVSISFTTFRIMTFPRQEIWSFVPGYNEPLGGAQQIYWNFADLVSSNLHLFIICK